MPKYTPKELKQIAEYYEDKGIKGKGYVWFYHFKTYLLPLLENKNKMNKILKLSNKKHKKVSNKKRS